MALFVNERATGTEIPGNLIESPSLFFSFLPPDLYLIFLLLFPHQKAVLTYDPHGRSGSAGAGGSGMGGDSLNVTTSRSTGTLATQNSFSIPSPVIAPAPVLASGGKGLFNGELFGSVIPFPRSLCLIFLACLLVRVLYDYEPQGDEELALIEGEVIPVISTEEDPWWEGEKKGKCGMFPSNFVVKV